MVGSSSSYRPHELVMVRDCWVTGETDRAIKVCSDGGDEVWIPKSQIHDDSEVYEMGTEGILLIPEWLAIEKSLDYEEHGVS